MDVCEDGESYKMNFQASTRWSLIRGGKDYRGTFTIGSLTLGAISFLVNFCILIVISKSHFRSLFLNLHSYLKILSLFEFFLVLSFTLDKNLFSLLIKIGNCVTSCAQLIQAVKIISDTAFMSRNWFIIFINFSELNFIFDYIGLNRALSSPRKLRLGILLLCILSTIISLIFNSVPIYLLQCKHQGTLPILLNRTATKWQREPLDRARIFSIVLQFILSSTLPLIILCITAIFIIIKYVKRIEVGSSRAYHFERNEVITKTVIGLNINGIIFQFLINIGTFFSHYISNHNESMYYSSIFAVEILTIVQGNFNAAIYAYVHTPLMYDHFKDLQYKQIHLQNL